MEILEMTSLKLKDSNNVTKVTLTPNSLNIADLFINKIKYVRKHEDKTTTIFFDNPIKKCFRRKMKRNTQYFKPKNETINIVEFALNRGVLKINENL